MKLTIDVKTLDEKSKSNSTLIIDLLKKFGVPGGQAVKIFQQNRPEYIVRKCFLFEYYKTEQTTPILSSMKWLQHAIRNDYNEPERFNNWYKARREDILANGNADLKQLILM
jgi:hypothetical protein